MFIIVPSIFILISLVGVILIVRRKLPYLRKLSPDAHQVSDHLVEDYFPELVNWVNRIKWREYRQTSLLEIEKFLRRSRLVLLKIDHVSDRLINKVRKTHLTNRLEHAATQIEKPSEIATTSDSMITGSTPDDLKAREQQLIIDIAQNPKDAGLYETLGDLYVEIGSTQDAQEAYEAALGFNPDNEVLARKYSALLRKNETENKF